MPLLAPCTCWVTATSRFIVVPYKRATWSSLWLWGWRQVNKKGTKLYGTTPVEVGHGIRAHILPDGNGYFLLLLLLVFFASGRYLSCQESLEIHHRLTDHVSLSRKYEASVNCAVVPIKNNNYYFSVVQVIQITLNYKMQIFIQLQYHHPVKSILMVEVLQILLFNPALLPMPQALVTRRPRVNLLYGASSIYPMPYPS